jgi:hypothetical protein
VSEDLIGRPSLLGGLAELAQLIGRRDWERAQALGQRLVADHPSSPTAHAALGDIAAARHLHREAAEWYELSLRLEANADVQQRLARARLALEAERAPEGEGVRPPREFRLGAVLAIAGGFLVVAVLIAAISVVLVHRRSRETASAPRGITRPTTRPGEARPVASGAPEPVTRPSVQPMAPERPGAGPAASAAAGPTGPVVNQVVSQAISGPMSDSDAQLTRSLGAVTWPNNQPLGVDVQAALDPFTGYCLVTAQVPKGMAKTPLYPLALDTAYKLAVTALRTDQAVDTLTIRVLVTIIDESGKQTTLVALRGNTTRKVVDYYLEHNPQPDQQTLWGQVFATTWWNPSVAGD